MKRDITELFCAVDNFAEGIEEELRKNQLSCGEKPSLPTRTPGLCMGQIMTIILLFQQSPCKNFKYFYKGYLTFVLP